MRSGEETNVPRHFVGGAFYYDISIVHTCILSLLFLSILSQYISVHCVHYPCTLPSTHALSPPHMHSPLHTCTLPSTHAHMHSPLHTCTGQVVLRCLLSDPNKFDSVLREAGLNQTIVDAITNASISAQSVVRMVVPSRVTCG